MLELCNLSDTDKWLGRCFAGRAGSAAIKSTIPLARRDKQIYVDLLQSLRAQTAIEKGLHHGQRKGVLRLM